MRKDYRVDGNTIYISFENGNLEIQVVTGQIVRIFSQLSEECPISKAIEGDKNCKVLFDVREAEECIQICIPEFVIKIYDEAKVDIYDRQGTPVCLDYRGGRVPRQAIDPEMMQFMEQEGHCLQGNAGNHAVQVVKQMDGDECFYGLGDKTGFLNKRGYEYMNWNTDNPAPHLDNFRALYKSIPFLSH